MFSLKARKWVAQQGTTRVKNGMAGLTFYLQLSGLVMAIPTRTTCSLLIHLDIAQA